MEYPPFRKKAAGFHFSSCGFCGQTLPRIILTAYEGKVENNGKTITFEAWACPGCEVDYIPASYGMTQKPRFNNIQL